MAGNAISLDILANVRDALRGVGDLEQAISDVESTLEDMSDAGDSSVDKMSRGFRDLAKDAEKSADKIERSFKDTGKGIGTGVDEGTDKARQGLDDFKGEADGTAREVAASFDGSAESIAGGFQELAANAFGSFGPAGAVAGLAAAAGIGLAVSGFTAADEARKASEERVSEWADSFIEAGGRALTAGVMSARAIDILTDPEKFKEAEKNQKEWGVSIETAIAAMSGNAGALSEVASSVGQLGDAYEEAKKKAPAIDEQGNINAQLLLQEKGYRAAEASLSKLTGEMQTGQQRAQVMNRYYENLINTTAGVTREVDDLGNELYTLPDKTQILVNAETRQASANVDDFKGDVDGIPENVTTRVRVVPDTAAWDAKLRQIQQMSLIKDVIIRPGQVVWY